jgi:CheY-like chemotaxis protein
LLEDGLQKIRQGLTSFESLNKVAKSIPAAYEKAVEESRAGGDVIDVDGASSFETDDLASEMSPTAADHPRLLIVEDDPDQRKILETLFRAEGYEVFQAEHGKQALEVLECQEVELVIADLMMPHMNGSEMVKEIRAASGFSQVPILMLTAVDNPDAEYALLDAGADGYCPKNVKRKVLLKRVERLLSRG